MKWPGAAAVVVSVVHVARGTVTGPYDLDGRLVDRITAFLFHAGADDDPVVLRANANKSFQGSIVLGMSFTFDDTDKSGIASPISLMHELVRKDPRNAERVFPYIGGEEVNDSPTHAHHRFVINFGQMPLRREDVGAAWADADDRTHERWLRSGILPIDYPDPVAADWPDLLAIVEQKVKPQRDTDNRAAYRNYWWQYAEKRAELTNAIRGPNGAGRSVCLQTPRPGIRGGEHRRRGSGERDSVRPAGRFRASAVGSMKCGSVSRLEREERPRTH